MAQQRADPRASIQHFAQVMEAALRISEQRLSWQDMNINLLPTMISAQWERISDAMNRVNEAQLPAMLGSKDAQAALAEAQHEVSLACADVACSLMRLAYTFGQSPDVPVSGSEG
jgi:hypothetical protein